MASTDLVVAGEQSSYAVLKWDPDELQKIIAENIGADTISPTDLDRVKVPAGGSTSWEIPTLDDTVASKKLEGIVLHWTNRRAYWKDKYDGGSESPDCSSPDGVQGYGDPGVACVECPLSQWGSAEDNVGQACKAMRQLFILTDDSVIPIVLTLPPSSIAPAKQFMLRLVRAGMSIQQIVVRIELEKAQSRGGIEYSKVKFSKAADLDPEAYERIQKLAQQLGPSLTAAAGIDRDDASGDE
jgi:hypothetical protein